MCSYPCCCLFQNYTRLGRLLHSLGNTNLEYYAFRLLILRGVPRSPEMAVKEFKRCVAEHLFAQFVDARDTDRAEPIEHCFDKSVIIRKVCA